MFVGGDCSANKNWSNNSKVEYKYFFDQHGVLRSQLSWFFTDWVTCLEIVESWCLNVVKTTRTITSADSAATVNGFPYCM